MGHLVMALDSDLGVSPAELAAAWDADEQAQAVGPASLEASVRGEFFPDVLTLVAIPVTRLVARLRNSRPHRPEIEVAQLTSADGDRIVVVRLRGARS